MNFMHLLGDREEEKYIQSPSGIQLGQRLPALAAIRAQWGQITTLYPVMFTQEWKIRTVGKASLALPELQRAATGQAAELGGRGKEAARALPAPSTSGSPPSPSLWHLRQQLAERYPKIFDRDKEETQQNPDLRKSKEI